MLEGCCGVECDVVVPWSELSSGTIRYRKNELIYFTELQNKMKRGDGDNKCTVQCSLHACRKIGASTKKG